MRLIDAEVFEELFYKQIEYGATDIFDAVEDALQDTPTIDAVPVVHAHWIKTFNSDGFVSTLRCSECGNAENATYIPGNFCWFCGARMDAEENG